MGTYPLELSLKFKKRGEEDETACGETNSFSGGPIRDLFTYAVTSVRKSSLHFPNPRRGVRNEAVAGHEKDDELRSVVGYISEVFPWLSTLLFSVIFFGFWILNNICR